MGGDGINSPYLSPEVLKQIQSFEVKEDTEAQDLVYWKGGTKGKFTIKSALRLMRHETGTIDYGCWDLIWSSPTQQRVRAFLWLAFHDRLLGNLNRFKRKVTDDAKCCICGATEESTLHILRDCATAKMVWHKLGRHGLASTFYIAPLKQWLSDHLKTNSHPQSDHWATYFSIATWCIWRWRNTFVFNRSAEVSIDIAAFLQIWFDETRRSLYNDDDHVCSI